MTRSESRSAAADLWREFSAYARSDRSDREVVEFLLGRLSDLLGAEGAALYSEQGGLLERAAVSGADRFPLRVEPSSGEDPQTVAVPGGIVRFRMPPGRAAVLSPEGHAALSAAVRAYGLSRKMKRQRFEVNYRGVELEALYDVGLAITSTLNLDELSEEVLLRAVSLLDARRGALYLKQGEELVLHRTFGGEARERLFCGSPEVEALVGSDFQSVPDVMRGAEYLLCVPIETDRGRQGLLLMGDKESRQGVGPFRDEDRRTLSMFANQASIAIQNAHLHRQALEKERLEREAELAAEIQRRLLPDAVPTIDGYELAGWNRPARLVGGDYFGFLRSGDDRCAFCVADVTGKGMPAALMVSTLHSALRLLMEHGPLDEELLSGLNRHIWESSAPNKFITLFMGVLEPASGRLSYLSAGHNPALLLSPDGGVSELGIAGMPLGLFEDAQYTFAELQMDPGSLLCVYSDGITECESPEEVEFGIEGLSSVLRENGARSLDTVVQTIDDSVTKFAAGAPQADDQTLVLLRRRAA